MHWNRWIRQSHRWLSMAFMVTLIVCFAALALPQPANWVFYLPLLPLTLMMFSGLYLFVLPYVIKRRARQGAAVEN